MSAALYTALTGQAADSALTLIRREGPGSLYVCSEHFVDAMADLAGELSKLSAAATAGAFPDLKKLEEVDRAWLATGVWPRSVSSTSGRIGRIHCATVARQRQQPLYLWHGPDPSTFAAAGVDL